MIIALAGNPNCGKTTLFNRLTGDAQHVGNWPGVTVEKRTGQAGEMTVLDLPGAYSLNPYSPEEKITADYLCSHAADVIVSVIDGTCMERSLYLTTQIAELGMPMIVAVNMMDDVRKRGISIDTNKLSLKLGVPVVPISARTGEGIDALLSAVTCACHVTLVGSVTDAAQRYRHIEALLAGCTTVSPAGESLSDRVDRIVLHPWAAYPILVLIMSGVFAVIFRAGDIGASWISQGFDVLAGFSASWLEEKRVAPGLADLVTGGIFPGISSVLTFTPMMFLLFFCLSLLEDSGYMARAAFILDAPMRWLGLSGKSLFPLMMGCGCTVTAVMAARSVADPAERRRTVRLTPFVACGAKMPVCAMIAGLICPGHTGLIMFSMITGGLVLGIACAIWRRSWQHMPDTPLMLEMPDYRLPDLLWALRSAMRHGVVFVKRVMTVIILSSMIVWLLRSFTFGLIPANGFAQSMLGVLSSAAAPLMAPIGLGRPEIIASLVSGIFAKENIISTLAVLSGGHAATLFSAPGAAVSFMLFAMIYTPCTAALSAIASENGWREAVKTMAAQTLLAWFVSFFMQICCQIVL